MRLSCTRVVVWSTRLLSAAIALWWPALWRDPVYTPRQARLTGQELRLPSETEPDMVDDRALAIFWTWEHRVLVKTCWLVGPYRGLREPGGRTQTLLMMLAVWVVGSGLLFLQARQAPVLPNARQRGNGVAILLATPLWQLLTRPRRDTPPQ